jgi:iron complex outermembrane receptor protein
MVSDATLLTDQIEDRHYANIFSQLNWQWNQKTSIEVGLNQNLADYTRNQLVDNVKDRYQFNQILSPRISVNYSVKKDASFYFNVSHGFSPPSVQETLNPDGLLNPNIQAEKGWNTEIGSRGSLLSGKLFYDIVVYRMHIKDLLVARRTAEDQYIGLNAGSSMHRGLEFDLQYTMFKPAKRSSAELLSMQGSTSIIKVVFMEM